MLNLLEKLSSYNIFNNLLPGVVFVSLGENLQVLKINHDNWVELAFLYYFIGMVISRIGSLVLEPFLKKVKLLKFADYSKFVIANRIDSKVEVLSETNNTYRTLATVALLILAAEGKSKLGIAAHWSAETETIILVVVIFLLFVLSYRKQSNYITKRVDTLTATKPTDISPL